LDSFAADLVLKDKIFVYDVAGQRIGWTNYDCKFHLHFFVDTYQTTRKDSTSKDKTTKTQIVDLQTNNYSLLVFVNKSLTKGSNI